MSAEVEAIEAWLAGYCFGVDAAECLGAPEGQHFPGCSLYKENKDA